MDESGQGPDRFHQELRETEDSLLQQVISESSSWQLKAGPFRISAKVPSQTITMIYISFNVACLIAGVIFSFAGGALANLGIAIVVGALFAFGSFVAQVWTVAVQRELEVVDRVFADSWASEMKQLVDKRAQLIEKIENLRQEQRESDSTGNRANKEQPPAPTVAGL